MDSREYDRFLQNGKVLPTQEWTMHKILRVRAFSDDFSRIRPKLREAENCSQTDLNSSFTCDDGSNSTRSRRTRQGKPGHKSSRIKNNFESSDEEVPQPNLCQRAVNIMVPKPPPKPQLTYGTYMSQLAGCSKSNGEGLSKRDGSKLSSPDEKFHNSSGDGSGSLKLKDVRPSHDDLVLPNGTLTHDKFKKNPGPPGSRPLQDSKSFFCQTDPGVDSHLKVKVQEKLSCPPVEVTHVKMNSKTSTRPVVRNLFDKNPTEGKQSNLDEKSVKVTTVSRSTGTGSNKPVKDNTGLAQTETVPSGQPEMHQEADALPLANNTSTPHVSPDQSNLTPDANNNSQKRLPKQVALDLAKKMSEDDFKAYAILNFTEMRSQLKEIMNQFGKTSFEPRRGTRRTVNEENASFIQEDEDDPLHGLPALDIEIWEQFNNKLEKEKAFASDVVKKLKDHADGETDLGEYIRKILSRIITNTLASEYSWKGRLGNRAFETLFIVKVIRWMIGKYTKYPREKNDVKKVISTWLRLAPQRSGGKHFQKYKTNTRSNGDQQWVDLEGGEEGENLDCSKPSKTSTPRKSTPKKSTLKKSTPKKSTPKKRKTASLSSPLKSPHAGKKKQRSGSPQSSFGGSFDLDNHLDLSSHVQSKGIPKKSEHFAKNNLDSSRDEASADESATEERW